MHVLSMRWGVSIIFGGWGGNVKMHMKWAKICHFYAEIVKFGLILTHLKSFWEKVRAATKIFLGESRRSYLVYRTLDQNVIYLWGQSSCKDQPDVIYLGICKYLIDMQKCCYSTTKVYYDINLVKFGQKNP